MNTSVTLDNCSRSKKTDTRKHLCRNTSRIAIQEVRKHCGIQIETSIAAVEPIQINVKVRIPASRLLNWRSIPMMLCSGGGGRCDYEALKYFTEFWPSDNTDAVERIFIQWGYSYTY